MFFDVDSVKLRFLRTEVETSDNKFGLSTTEYISKYILLFNQNILYIIHLRFVQFHSMIFVRFTYIFLRTALLFSVELDASATSLLKYLLLVEGFFSSLPRITFRLEKNKLTKSYKLSYKANSRLVTSDTKLIIHLRISQYSCVCIQR